MGQSFIAAAKMMMQPSIKEIEDTFIQALRSQPLIQESEIKARAQKNSEDFQTFILGEEELSRLELGFKTILKEINPKQIKEISQAGQRILEETQEFTLPVYQTLQEMFELSDDIIDAMYSIGTAIFNKNKISEALNVYLLVTTLNPHLFEPWLGRGICWQSEKRFPEALQAFSMASLLNFHDPSAHLFAAEVYLQMRCHKLAEDTLQLALSKMDKKQKEEFKSHIDYLKKGLKK